MSVEHFQAEAIMERACRQLGIDLRGRTHAAAGSDRTAVLRAVLLLRPSAEMDGAFFVRAKTKIPHRRNDAGFLNLGPGKGLEPSRP